MSTAKPLSIEKTHNIRDSCLCLHVQRAARTLARRFDDALRPVALNNGQFSLLMALNRPGAPSIGDLADLLAMDRTTLTAALKPLKRRGLVKIAVAKEDRRSRRLSLTSEGRAVLQAAYPLWKKTHAATERMLARPANALRDDLRALS